jgi:hypothetical protein
VSNDTLPEISREAAFARQRTKFGYGGCRLDYQRNSIASTRDFTASTKWVLQMNHPSK